MTWWRYTRGELQLRLSALVHEKAGQVDGRTKPFFGHKPDSSVYRPLCVRPAGV
jgi:hypothetical protein